MRRATLVLVFVVGWAPVRAQTALPNLRPPAIPLLAHDPYFSVWSLNDKLTGDHTRHWSGKEQHLTGLIRIDGQPFRFMGSAPRDVEAMDQKAVQVTPTRTIYTFEKSSIRLKVTFLTPAFPESLDVLARPLSYVVLDAQSIDDTEHDVTVYFDVSSLLAVNSGDQRVAGARLKVKDLHVVRVGTQAQDTLAKSGDDLRIDWGYAYLAAPNRDGTEVRVRDTGVRAAFAKEGKLPDRDEFDGFAPNTRVFLAMAAVFNFGKLRSLPVSRYAMVAYDDLYSVQYFNRNLRPYWRRTGPGGKAVTIDTLLETAEAEYLDLQARAEKFDRELTDDLVRVGGSKYAQIATLAYRQTLAAHKLTADADGRALFFAKDNAAAGGIAVVDAIYAAAPFYLMLNPELLRAALVPVLQYAQMPRWQFKFAPHDLGQYPLAGGQNFAGGEKSEAGQMAIEETSSLLLLVAALARTDRDTKFAKPYWGVLTKWAEYLKDKGVDPEDQPSVDDAGEKLARNANLSLKSILALGAYADLARTLDDAKVYDAYWALAREHAQRWQELVADGSHTTMSFGQAGSWSQKYHLVWDRVLELGIFPEELGRKEVAHYLTQQGRYGLPLDSRDRHARLDATFWSASLAEPRDFDEFANAVFDYLHETPTRVPMADWYWTHDAKQKAPLQQARGAVGGVYMKMLMDKTIWEIWLDRARAAANGAKK